MASHAIAAHASPSLAPDPLDETCTWRRVAFSLSLGAPVGKPPSPGPAPRPGL